MIHPYRHALVPTADHSRVQETVQETAHEAALEVKTQGPVSI